ncbi:hypothetical protein [Streptomyces corynorhini]|uniref:Uncharacterized protein n=1 Tax=Streptomyces corynorhini TaxID=2282652 RepID=A0A370B3Q3_9ACTN|nr:hypothetical protein [Streptomyces corynorhini]RDG34694.1 hypothetical protein DVH02_29235 [Streptomyces corynorhini]
MSEPNPHADGGYNWGPPGGAAPGGPAPDRPTGSPEYDFPPPTLADGMPGGTMPGGPVGGAPGGGAPAYGYPAAAPGYGYPQQGPGYAEQLPVPMGAGGGAPVLAIGDITVVGDQIVTPSGPIPLRGAVWNATDMSRTEERIPPVAIVLAIVFALLCLIGLLFLLMKEKKTTGFIQVTVTGGGRHHATMIPANHPDAFQMVMGQVNYGRSLSSM